MAESSLTRLPRGRVIAVMVNWNGRAFLEAAVASVLAELTPEDDLLVVDNDSADGSFELLRQRFPRVAVLQTGENLGGAGGFAAGARIALRDPGCRYVWLLDNDIVVETGALAPLLSALDADEKAAAAGSQLCLYGDPEVIQEIGAGYSPWHGGLRQYGRGRQRLGAACPAREVDYLAACSLLVKVDALRCWGLLREDFFVFYDDVEWSRRVRREGGRLWAVPASVVRHCYGAVKATAPWREYYRKRNRCVCLRLHPPRFGGLPVLYVYLAYLNYLGRFLAGQGDRSLSQAYRWAAEDFLAGRCGRRQFDSARGSKGFPGELQEETMVWVHHGLPLGDALAALDAISARNRRAVCYLSAPTATTTALTRRSGVVLGEAPAGCRLAVVGEVYDWRAACFPVVIRYRCDDRWERLSDPVGEYWRSRWRMAVALFVAAVAALPQWLVAVRRQWPSPPFP